MGAVDLGGGGRSHKKGGGVKKPKRIGFKLDMTPLVDVAFLLLTFFMFATTMSQPQIMEMFIPPDVQSQIEVKASELLTIFISADGELFYATGLEPANFRKVPEAELSEFAVQRNREKENRLITILKVDPKAKYEKVVKVLDRLNQAEAVLTDEYAARKQKRDRRFSIMPLEPEFKEAIDKL
jgi:biopolymer transport protein ExbD